MQSLMPPYLIPEHKYGKRFNIKRRSLLAAIEQMLHYRKVLLQKSAFVNPRIHGKIASSYIEILIKKA